MAPWPAPTMCFPPPNPIPPPFPQPLHVWGHPTAVDKSMMQMWPKYISHSPAAPHAMYNVDHGIGVPGGQSQAHPLLDFHPLGGPTWTVPLGRRDVRTASQSAANSQIHGPASNLATIVSQFTAKGLNA